MPRLSSRPLRASLCALAALTFFASVPACSPAVPAPGPEARCADACAAKARSCSAAQCARGCRLVLDKLVEHEGSHVLACVARITTSPARPACSEATFAECAAVTGPYADGGPAPPRPPSDDDQP